MKNYCDNLADTANFNLFQDMDEEFVEATCDSWYSWLTFGKMINTTVHATEEVQIRIDRTMNDLPTVEEAQKRLPDMIKRIKD